MSDEPGFLPLSEATVAVLGLGLMGGSLAMALRGQCRALIAIDPDPATLDLAREWNLADRLAAAPGELVAQADWIVLAAPVGAILHLLADLPGLHPGSPVVIDLGSTKREILRAMQALPERFDPLGGHPMCGKEHSSLANAEAGLYRGAPFALVPLERSGSRARAAGEELARAAGARPLWLDAETHDRWTAATSHLPTLAAAALAGVTPAEAAPLAGPGFRSTSRLAAQPAAVMLDVLMSNRDLLRPALAGLRRALEEADRLLETGDRAGLSAFLQRGADRRAEILSSGGGL